MTSKDWTPEINFAGRPRYIEIAEAIRTDIESGRLSPGDRLPPQRRLAKSFNTDVSTISRSYAEAVRRGYVEAHVGRGTFVRDLAASGPVADPRRTLEEDPRMNMPPEPEDPELIARMRAGLEHLCANIVPLLRYQAPIGSSKDREIAKNWMHANDMDCVVERLVVTPGAHAAIHAVLSILSRPGTTVLCESVTYSGIRAIAARLDLPLIGLEEDEDGITPDALDAALRAHEHCVLYLNPTLRNPTTHTMPAQRRTDIARILEAHGSPLIEDDAYCFVASDAPPPISHFLPELGWHVAGISKVFGAGLRLAYVQVPGEAWHGPFVKALRTTNVMASPISLALLSTWIEDGTASELQTFVRTAAAARQEIAKEVLEGVSFTGHPNAFNIWLTLPEKLSRAEALARQTGRLIGIMPSDVFIPSGGGQEKLRVCLGGPITLDDLRNELKDLRESLSQSDWAG